MADVPLPAREYRRSSLTGDVASAYLASGCRIGAWVVVSAILFRRGGEAEFAMFALARGTMGLLNHCSLGLGPAMIRLFAEAWRAASGPDAKPDRAQRLTAELNTLRSAVASAPTGNGAAKFPADHPAPASSNAHAPSVAPPPDSDAPAIAPAGLPTIGYATRFTPPPTIWQPPIVRSIFFNGVRIAGAGSVVALILTYLYAFFFKSLHRLPEEANFDMFQVVYCLGWGILFRVITEPISGFLQAHRRIALDNILVAGAEIIWAVLTLYWSGSDRNLVIENAASAFMAGSCLLFLARIVAVHGRLQPGVLAGRDAGVLIRRRLLAFGSMVVLANLADYLYAPTDFILINRLLDPALVGVYAPAVQIDSGLLLLVSGLAAVLLPHAAVAHVAGDSQRVRRYYLRGTLISAALLTAASALLYAVSGPLLQRWLGQAMPRTQAILPLVFISTVVGGSAMVGRSILLGMGRAKAFGVSVLIAGTVNVIASYVFARYFDWGLMGIVLGTTVAVVGRCAVWMPWYVMRVLHETAKSPLVEISNLKSQI